MGGGVGGRGPEPACLPATHNLCHVWRVSPVSHASFPSPHPTTFLPCHSHIPTLVYVPPSCLLSTYLWLKPQLTCCPDMRTVEIATLGPFICMKSLLHIPTYPHFQQLSYLFHAYPTSLSRKLTMPDPPRLSQHGGKDLASYSPTAPSSLFFPKVGTPCLEKASSFKWLSPTTPKLSFISIPHLPPLLSSLTNLYIPYTTTTTHYYISLYISHTIFSHHIYIMPVNPNT